MFRRLKLSIIIFLCAPRTVIIKQSTHIVPGTIIIIIIIFIIYGINYYWLSDSATAKQLPPRGNTRKP